MNAEDIENWLLNRVAEAIEVVGETDGRRNEQPKGKDWRPSQTQIGTIDGVHVEITVSVLDAIEKPE